MHATTFPRVLLVPALLGLLGLSAVPTTAAVQTNQIAGLDVSLSELKDMESLGRMGAFPNGINGASFLTTACNVGSVEVAWKAAMKLNHPKIAFLFARESSGRLEQISDRSYVKHGFFAANASMCGVCNPPLGPLGESLGIGCSDTYSTNTNGNRFWLGPAQEINPWLGSWERTCSHFDRGEPAVSAPGDCDQVRSLTTAQVGAFDPVQHRIEIADADLLVAGATFYAQAHYVAIGEAERLRGDNVGYRRYVPSWSGEQWNFGHLGPVQLGSVLEAWNGARVSSNTNSGEDGRVFVAVRVTQPSPGTYHYEYALHNRDAARGVGALHIPKCGRAHIRNFGFRDIDEDAFNQWGLEVEPDSLSFSSPSNPIEWNTIYNFWFDSDAEPVARDLTLDAFAPGAGNPSYSVRSLAPAGIYTVYLGTGCAKGQVPELYATGTPSRPSLGNASFALTSTGNLPGQRSLLVLGSGAANGFMARCSLGVGRIEALLSNARADEEGVAVHPLPIPMDAALEGIELDVQCITGGSEPARDVGFSNALRIRVGTSVVDCP